MNRNDWLLYISFLLIIIGVVIVAYWSYTYNVNKCTSDPIKYAVNRIKDTYDTDYVYGKITFLDDKTKQYQSWEFGDDFLNLK